MHSLGVLFVACSAAFSLGCGQQEAQDPDKKYNRLINETSPYLLSHAENPVDWYPWGPEALAKAVNEDKLLFVSVGYSTCHWCHVMERESFTDQEVADKLAADFVAIKIDREEMPDLDHVFMTYAQAFNQRGGWPNNVILTPDQKPLTAFTYVPRDQFAEFLPEIGKVWREQREAVLADADRIAEAMKEILVRAEPGEVSSEAPELAAAGLMERFDDVNGGFGSRPKFPTPQNLLLLLRAGKRTGNQEWVNAVSTTLTKMRLGGIYDQVGWGFHRYATDAIWRIPHFEKMLYDQAMLIMAYVEAWQVTGEPLFRQTAEEIIAYVNRDLSDPAGGFWSAQDADSEEEEGKFYVWSDEELHTVLTDEEYKLVRQSYRFQQNGNFIDERSGEKTGLHIFERALDLEGQDEALDIVRKKLFDARKKRIHPLTDDKVLTDWNGLMIAALAKAGTAFNEPRHTARAATAASFIMSTMHKDGALIHTYRDGSSKGAGRIDDYAFMLWGLIELHQADLDPRWLADAKTISDEMAAGFWDTEAGGFFMSRADAKIPLARPKEASSGAIPSGNAAAALNLHRLGRLLADPKKEKMATEVLDAFGADIERVPDGFIDLMLAKDFEAGTTSEITIVGRADADDTKAMLQAIRGLYSPRTVIILKDPDDAKPTERLAAYTEAQVMIDGKATAYVCQNYACKLPTTDPAQAVSLLKELQN